MVLAQNDGLTQDELTKIVKVDKAATARRIRSLEKKKLFFEKLTLRIKGIKLYVTEKLQYKPLCKALKNSINS